ncbi:MAG: hypothetical protein AAFR67_08180 [Chloroflexota bacterium]
MLLAIATCYEEPTLFHDETPLTTALSAQDIDARPVIWNSPEVDWAVYDAILVRNTWDYHQQASIFSTWLDLLDSLKKPVINPTALLRWNMHKSYLREMSEQGVNIIPTVFVEDAQHSLLDVLNQQEWAEAIIKPMVGGSGDHIRRVSLDDCTKHEQSFGWLVDRFGMLVQPYLPEIEKDGEYSLVFFDGTYSHAMRKQPADGEFLVHEERGGSLKPYQPRDKMIDTATSIVAAVKQITGIQPTYTRVDGVLVNEEFLLMECECVEPELYFKHGSGAAEKLVRCILKALG